MSEDKKISSQSPGTGTRQSPGLWWADCACSVVSGQLESETVTSVAPKPIRPPLQVSPSVIQIVIRTSSCQTPLTGVFTPAQMTASSDPDQDSEVAQSRGEAYLVVM